MGELDGARIYLSGPIEYAKDAGVEWRREIIHKVKEVNGLKKVWFIDPTNKAGNTKTESMDEDKGYQQKLQDEGRYEELHDYVHKYRRWDLRAVDQCNAVIVNIDPTIPQWGTGNECFVGETQHKPIFAIVDGGLRKLPRWCFDVFDFENVFETVDEVVDRLVALDRGEYPMNDKWVIIDKYLI